LKELISIDDETRRYDLSRSQTIPSLLMVLSLLFVFIGATESASAQLNIPVLRGDNGLKSGSQPPPGVYLTGLVYLYDTHEIVDKDGTRFNRVSITQTAPLGVPIRLEEEIPGWYLCSNSCRTVCKRVD
jgi:hypothetical protein